LACLVPPGLEPLSGRISASYALGRRPHPYRQGSVPGPVSPGSAPATWANDVALGTVANRSVPMACGPNVDQACPARGGSGAPRHGSWLARETRPAAPDKRAHQGNRLVRGSHGGVWARDIPLYRGLSLVTAVVVPSTLRVQTTRTMVGAWAIWHHEPDRLRLGRWDSNPVPCCFASRGRGGEWPLTFIPTHRL
jgi:hypothetical protein